MPALTASRERGHSALTAEDPVGDEMTVLRDRQDKLEGRVAVLERTVEREAGLRAREAALRAKMTRT